MGRPAKQYSWKPVWRDIFGRPEVARLSPQARDVLLHLVVSCDDFGNLPGDLMPLLVAAFPEYKTWFTAEELKEISDYLAPAFLELLGERVSVGNASKTRQFPSETNEFSLKTLLELYRVGKNEFIHVILACDCRKPGKAAVARWAQPTQGTTITRLRWVSDKNSSETIELLSKTRTEVEVEVKEKREVKGVLQTAESFKEFDARFSDMPKWLSVAIDQWQSETAPKDSWGAAIEGKRHMGMVPPAPNPTKIEQFGAAWNRFFDQYGENGIRASVACFFAEREDDKFRTISVWLSQQLSRMTAEKIDEWQANNVNDGSEYECPD